jgi:hypothetical protein
VGRDRAAIVMRETVSPAGGVELTSGGLEALLAALFLFALNPILGHATARAARLQERGTLAPRARSAPPPDRRPPDRRDRAGRVRRALGRARRNPRRQVIVNGVYGLSLALLFVILQAPDVALSMLVVNTVAYPLVLLVAIGVIRHEEDEDE